MRFRRLLIPAAALGGVVAAAASRSKKRRPAPTAPARERRGQPDPEALRRAEAPGASVGFDLKRLQALKDASFTPVLEHLRYIQVQRGGDSESLLFVRGRDLEALATISGRSTGEFMESLQELGVILSMN